MEKTMRKQTDKTTTETELRRLAAKFGSAKQIAEALGIRPHYVSTTMTCLGIKAQAKRNGPGINMVKVRAMQSIGMTGQEICRSMKVTPATLSKALNAATETTAENAPMSGVDIDAIHRLQTGG